MFITDYLDVCDPVIEIYRLLSHIDINRYLDDIPHHKLGRLRYDPVRMFKTVVFDFADHGYVSLRQLEDDCKTNIRYMYLMDRETPTYKTFGDFINLVFKKHFKEIFDDINARIFKEDHVDLNHIYIDGSKFEADANKYSWVWKKATERSRYRLYQKITVLINDINSNLTYMGERAETRSEYAPEYLNKLLENLKDIWNIDEITFVHGSGHRKSPEQRMYETLKQYASKLEEYVEKIEICGPDRNSYSKTDHSATFMRMKFPMFKKETEDKKYKNNPFRAVNFRIDENGVLRCPNDKAFHLQYRKNVRGNKYGRQEEIYQCEDCSGCPYAEQCKKTDKNRTISLNQELTSMHQEVIDNLESIQGALLRMNRSIQSEGTFGIMKYDRWYKRLVRRGMDSVELEVFLVSIGHNLYKYCNKRARLRKAA